MKKVTSIVLIILLSAQCFYKLSVIAYFQLNRDYIAEVLCINKERPITMCYGQCFLKTNLNLADHVTGEDGAKATSKLQFEFPSFLVSTYTTVSAEFASNDRKDIFHSQGTPSNYSAALFRPPAIRS